MKKTQKEAGFRFVVSDCMHYEKKLGEVTAGTDNFVEAAFRAARELFKLPCARRDTGWPGKPGWFVAYNNDDKKEIRFYMERAS